LYLLWVPASKGATTLRGIYSVAEYEDASGGGALA
jgi:hypothetical protein